MLSSLRPLDVKTICVHRTYKLEETIDLTVELTARGDVEVATMVQAYSPGSACGLAAGLFYRPRTAKYAQCGIHGSGFLRSGPMGCSDHDSRRRAGPHQWSGIA